MGHVIAYASRTGTRRNLAALREAGWRLMLSATGVHRTEGFPYAIDNGEWTAHQARERAQTEHSTGPVVPREEPKWTARTVTLAFIRLVLALGAGADFVIAPDIVAGGAASLARSLKWLPWVLSHAPRALLAVQDGMETDHVEAHLGARVGIFVGGSTAWKLRTMPAWGGLAKRLGVWFHVGRVNTQRRIKDCYMAGATSFDGSSASRFADSLPVLERALAQPTLFGRD